MIADQTCELKRKLHKTVSQGTNHEECRKNLRNLLQQKTKQNINVAIFSALKQLLVSSEK